MSWTRKPGFPRYAGVIVYSLIAAILAGLVARLFFGVEMTDEAYYVAMAARFALGNAPFHDIWDWHQTSALLYSPLTIAFRSIAGDFDGIMLFMRIMMFCFSLAIAAMIYNLLKRILGMKALLLSLPLVVIAPYSIYNFSYNSLHLLLATAGCFLVFAALYDSGGNSRFLFLALAGILHGLAAFAYPAALLLCAVNIVIIIRLFESRAAGGGAAWMKPLLAYILSGTAILAVLALIIILCSGFENVLNGFSGAMASSNYIHREVTPHMRLIKVSQLILSPVNPFFVHKIIVLGAWNLLLYQCFKTDKRSFLLVLAGGYILLILYCASRVYKAAWTGGSAINLSEFIVYSAMLAPFLLFYTERNRQLFKRLLIITGIPSITVWLEAYLISMARLSTSGFLLVALALLSPVFIVLLFEEFWQPVSISPGRDMSASPELSAGMVSPLATVVFTTAICGLFLFYFYGYVFRDGDIWRLSEKVNTGVYCGLYTQPERARRIEFLERELEKYEDPSKTLMVLDHVPYVYMFTQMKPLSPYSMDVSLSRFGEYLSEPAFKYFEHLGALPGLIFFVGEEGMVCYDNPDYELTSFIKDKYTLIHSNDTGIYLRVMELKRSADF